MSEQLVVRRLGRVDYEPTWRAMQDFTARRGDATADELWLCEHPPVFTLGLAGRPEHLLRDVGIPVVKIDRGGQITYHGPGQLVAYLLLDLKRRKLMVRELVARLEQAVIDLLGEYGVAAQRLPGAPGVYVATARSGGGPAAGGGAEQRPQAVARLTGETDVPQPAGCGRPASGTQLPDCGAQGNNPHMAGGLSKIAALGLRVKNGCCYHGLAFNVDMDLAPFSAINPCGYEGMAVTQLRDVRGAADSLAVADGLIAHLRRILEP